MVPRPFRVASRAQDTADTWTLTLEPAAGDGPSIAPGQFMMVTAFGIGEVPISVSGPPARPGPVVLTVRSVGAVSRAICAAEPGRVLGLRGPFGNAWPVDSASGDVLVVAGGIGLAPLRPVVLRALERRAELGAVSLVYGARTPADLLYGDEREEWARSIEVGVTVDSASPGWTGHVGVVTKLLGRAHVRHAETSAFVCGPEIMMRFTAEALVEDGVAPERIFLSMERHMDCGVGLCGHCQLGPTLICRDGPVYSYAELAGLMEVREL
ncbi:MAG TPA: FAD/NAD(P)-binding protein [Gaiellaceae bacterium]|nr:FAD/NAD(P)-binding protein [Gaiellaceae bacterium]